MPIGKLNYETLAGASFKIDPRLVGDIEKLIAVVDTEIDAAISNGKFIAYLSVPISNRGGGDFTTNTAMAASITERVQNAFGDNLFIVNPAKYNLPKAARGGDYMAVWADVLAGSNGDGSRFDMIYFAGPNDVWDFFDVEGAPRLNVIENWLDVQANTNDHYKEIAETAHLRKNFLRYYGLRGSAAYSKGAHDEWNIAMKFNAMREIGDDIAIYFDGTPIEPGDYDDATDAGYELLLHGV